MPARTRGAAKEESPEAPTATVAEVTWAERVADRSEVVQRSRDKGIEQARSIVAAARLLIETKGASFTTQELIREAGIALQTFYRYFQGKDYLMLAVIEDIIDEYCATFREQAQRLPSPVDRLRFYVGTTVRAIEMPGRGPSFITSEHFRLQTLYPAEVSRATQAYTELLVEEIEGALAEGQVRPHDPRYSAWLITQLTMAVFHHYDCAGLDEPIEQVEDKVWQFCLAALNGGPAGPPAAGARPRRAAKGRGG